MAKKQLLWLAPQAFKYKPDRQLLDSWALCRLRLDCKPAWDDSKLPSPRIGLLDLSEPGPTDTHFLQEWVDYLHPTYWVGLLPEMPTPGSRLAQFVSTYCADFHTFPCDHSRLSNCLGHLWGMAVLKSQIGSSTLPFCGVNALDGSSEAISRTKALLRRYARTREPVLILGSSGTGKESAARYIHEHSSVSQGPFVAIHCAALPESLTQSELFGHEKGAFTNAVAQRIGRIEAAQGGTLLLDGVDELLPQQQSILLRFLQEGKMERLGSHKVRQVDVRVLSTSSRSPELLISEGHFRPDLYYRLGVLQVTLPLLCERREDLALLAEETLAAVPGAHPGANKRLSREAFVAIVEHSWPGNIRELQNRLSRAALMSDSMIIGPEDMGLATLKRHSGPASKLTLERYRAEAEKRAATHALALSNNNLSAAARLLDISRLSLYRLIDKYGLERNGTGTSLPPAATRSTDSTDYSTTQ